jgi:hypothetical protein
VDEKGKQMDLGNPGIVVLVVVFAANSATIDSIHPLYLHQSLSPYFCHLYHDLTC